MECKNVNGEYFTTCDKAVKSMSALGSALRCVAIAYVEFPNSTCPLRDYSDSQVDKFALEEQALLMPEPNPVIVT